MNLEIPEIKNLITEGKKFYSVADSIKVFAPGSQWDGQGAQIYLESEKCKDAYSDEPTIAELIQRLKPPEQPPELSDFDKLLKGVMNAPKPKKGSGF